jgi:succinyl-diaminopimelate desuccinylase
MFAGHTDVVPPGDEAGWTHPPFSAAVEGGFMHGRGAVDMKGGIACFVAALARHVEAHGAPRGPVSLLITGDEEGPAINGTVKLLEWAAARGERWDAAIVGEPTNPDALGDMIKIGRRGSLTGDIVVHGRQGHIAYPHLADNPVRGMTALLDALFYPPLDEGTENFQPSNLEVTTVDVGNPATNVIPAKARATFNIRYNDTWRRPTIEAWVRAECAAAAATLNAAYDLEFSGTGDVFLTKPGVLVDTLAAAIKAETGRTPALSTGGGTSDARFIKDVCPVVEFGLVNTTIHAVDEHVPLADLERLTAIYQRFLAGYFATA